MHPRREPSIEAPRERLEQASIDRGASATPRTAGRSARAGRRFRHNAPIAVALLFLACDEAAPHLPPEPPPTPTPTVLAPPPIPDADDTWIGYERADATQPVSTGFEGLGIAPRVHVPEIGAPRDLAAGIEDEVLTITVQTGDVETWRLAIDAPGERAPVIAPAIEPDRLWVATVGDAVTVRAIEAGTVHWVERRDGAATSVQLAVRGEALHVYTLGPDGAEIEIRNANDGALRARRRLPLAVREILEQPAPTPLRPPESQWTLADGRTARARASRGRAILTLSEAGIERWRTVIQDELGVGCTPTLAVVEAADALIVTSHCGATSGAEVRALDLHNGGPRWRTRLHGIGSIGHSAYCNRVRLAIEGSYVVIEGVECGGRYRSIVDPASGRELAVRVFR